MKKIHQKALKINKKSKKNNINNYFFISSISFIYVIFDINFDLFRKILSKRYYKLMYLIISSFYYYYLNIKVYIGRRIQNNNYFIV